VTRVDLHCHSSASAVAGLAVQGTLGLPECATPPEEVHALAKRRGMDFVTITDHDTIDGVLAIADRPNVFVSEELTAAFRGEPQRVHVLCLGITRFCSRTDTFGQVVLEAQASGLPVVAVGEGGPAELIADGRSGLLCPARPEPLAAAVAGLAGSRAMRERLARGGLAAVRERTWDTALGRLAAGWHAALARHAAGAERRTA